MVTRSVRSDSAVSNENGDEQPTQEFHGLTSFELGKRATADAVSFSVGRTKRSAVPAALPSSTIQIAGTALRLVRPTALDLKQSQPLRADLLTLRVQAGDCGMPDRKKNAQTQSGPRLQ